MRPACLVSFTCQERRYGIVPGTPLAYELRSEEPSERDLRVLDRLGYGFHVPPRTPGGFQGLALNLARNCNLACTYCCVGQTGFYGGKPGLMTPQVAVESIRWLVRNRSIPRLSLYLFGGEPTLNWKALEAAVRATREHPECTWSLHLTTNGTMIDASRARFLAEHGVHTKVTIDGPEDLHDPRRPTKSGDRSHGMVLSGIQALLSAGAPMGLVAIMTPEGAERTTEAQDYLRRLATPRNHVAIGPESGWTSGPQAREAWSVVLQTTRRDLRDGRYPTQLARLMGVLLLGPAAPRPECPSGLGFPFVDIDGFIYNCHCSDLGNPSRRLGDVFSGLDPQKMTALRAQRDALPKKCEACWAHDLCPKGCPSIFAAGREPSDAFCAYSTEFIHEAVAATSNLTWPDIRRMYEPLQAASLQKLDQAYRLRQLARTSSPGLKPIFLFPATSVRPNVPEWVST
ncbi:MAG: radical SAM protein [Planctomycetes bacterium]|nr:radical SAM protein [Planctomycetota bacterium]